MAFERGRAAALALACCCLCAWLAGQATAECIINVDATSHIDLTPLSTQDWQATSPSFSYLLNPCQPLVYNDGLPKGASICGNTSYACQFTGDGPTAMLGDTSTIVTEGNSSTTVVISGGDYCPAFGTYRMAIIHLSCGPSIGSPVVIAENDCTSEFEWSSSAACAIPTRSHPNCIIPVNETTHVDLGQLSTQNWLAPGTGGYVYLLNPCLPLVYSEEMPEGNGICDESSYACQLFDGSGPSYLLGNQRTATSTGTETSVTITGGSYCPNLGTYRQVVISLSCGSDLGSPLLVSEVSCLYTFSWSSSAACPVTEALPTTVAPTTAAPTTEQPVPSCEAFDGTEDLCVQAAAGCVYCCASGHCVSVDRVPCLSEDVGDATQPCAAEGLTSQQTVIVACVASASVALIVLIAFLYVKGRRPAAQPNAGEATQVDERTELLS